MQYISIETEVNDVKKINVRSAESCNARYDVSDGKNDGTDSICNTAD